MSIARILIYMVLCYLTSQIIAQSCEVTPRYAEVMGLSGYDYQLPRQFHCTGAQRGNGKAKVDCFEFNLFFDKGEKIWQSKKTIADLPCHKILRRKLRCFVCFQGLLLKYSNELSAARDGHDSMTCRGIA